MARFSPRRILVPVIGLLDRSGKAPHVKPLPDQETTRFPEFPWDLRTIIIVFPKNAPFRFLNLNVLLGLTGVPFDRVEELGAIRGRDAFDLQFCLGGREREAFYKKYHSIGKELEYRPGEVFFKLGDRLEFEGSWPEYRISYRQPEEDLELFLTLDSWDDFHWWARFPGLYCHYTSFAGAKVEWRWGQDSGTVETTALHDHGWGRNLLPLRLPVGVFRYEVLGLPGVGYAVSLWTEAPLGFEIKNAALFRPDREPSRTMKHYECEVMEWDAFENYAGKNCRVPMRWLGRQKGAGEEFSYEARRTTEPRPIIGNGFIYGFDYRGELSGNSTEKYEGEGYVEQMGMVDG
jgi:hypothetical protein